MSSVTIQVRRVVEDWRRIGIQARRRKFEVWPTDPNGMYQTWDPFVASLCQRAHDLGRPITLRIRETKYGPEIVDAQIEARASR